MNSMSPHNGAAVGMSVASPSSEATVSPRQPVTPKNVAFELLFFDAPQYRARLPMRVQIYPHDTTDSIVTTVKNFYGLYSGPTGSKGVSFEDKDGNTLIARYENFQNNMVVYVRVFEEYPADSAAYSPPPYQSVSNGTTPYYPGDNRTRPSFDAGRPASRRRSPSPNASSRDRRSGSASSAGQKRSSRSVKTRTALSHADTYSDQYSSDDGAPSTTSVRAKEQQLGNTDISVENIVEGGRRKRAKFESSELPLFAPPQMPAATSNPSASPIRRMEHQRQGAPFANGANPFATPRPVQAAQAYTNQMQYNMYASESRRTRGNPGMAANGGVLPTPDHTVGSCMSEEDKDVALQLMRLGDMSNISHGRTSASTLDDTFSGRADAVSSTGVTSDGESDGDGELPATRRQKLDVTGASRHVYETTEVPFPPPVRADVSADEAEYEDRAPKSKVASKGKSSSASRPTKSTSSKGVAKSKKVAPPSGPMSPASQPPSRKQSIASTANVQPGEEDQPDLSTKPRCQRCRKSKKGCDRQRPCGRCRDAGLSAEQCVSEDEGNGRKGRYGRHMGVPIKKEEVSITGQPTLLPAAPISFAPTMTTAEKAKKRKR